MHRPNEHPHPIPRMALNQREPETRRRLELIVKQILLLEDSESGIHASDQGTELGGPGVSYTHLGGSATIHRFTGQDYVGN
jgi:hypothetical protein